jgi:Ethanolamine utilization protein, possible chaperonin
VSSGWLGAWGRPIKGIAAAAYPPGISEKTAKVFSTIVESLGFDCDGLYEEPTVAAETLGILNGAVVDIGGGTTGISILQGGDLVYCADEPTGGTHMTLVPCRWAQYGNRGCGRIKEG